VQPPLLPTKQLCQVTLRARFWFQLVWMLVAASAARNLLWAGVSAREFGVICGIER
jgi:hypothetical protein